MDVITVTISEAKYEQLIRQSECLSLVFRFISEEEGDYMNISKIKTILGIGGASK